MFHPICDKSCRRLVESALELAATLLEAQELSLTINYLGRPQQTFGFLADTKSFHGKRERICAEMDPMDCLETDHVVKECLFLPDGEYFGTLAIVNPLRVQTPIWHSQLEAMKDHITHIFEEVLNQQDANPVPESSLLELFSKVSHEIRTPLHALFGNARVLKETSLDEGQTELVDSILNSQQLLMNLVNEVLDFSRIKQESFKFVHKPTYLEEITAAVAGLYDQTALNQDLQIIAELDQVQLPVMVDPLRLTQMVGNLVSNALKFTERGSIVIRASRVGPLRYRFEIEDTGKGISPSRQQDIFKAYVRDESPENSGGTGLGLAIVQQLANRQGGAMGVESPIHPDNPTQPGTRFWFEINAEVASEERQPKEEIIHHYAGKTILLVDDDTLVQTLAIRMLDKEGVHTIIASSGQEALQHLHSKKIDAVFLDVEMEGLSGLETAKQIRKEVALPLPIVFSSSHREADIKAAAIEAGFTHFLPKPFNGRMLKKVLKELGGS